MDKWATLSATNFVPVFKNITLYRRYIFVNAYSVEEEGEEETWKSLEVHIAEISR